MSDRKIKQSARDLRKRQTPEEKKLWEILRNRKLYNLKFLRQHPISFTYNNKNHFYVSDFYCAELKLILEIDGEIHNYQIKNDELKDEILTSLGYNVVRFTNEVVNSNIDFVTNTIKNLTTNLFS
jgi:very-short-patch-repair endonuclease